MPLNYHIHQCKAPCQGYISAEEWSTRSRSSAVICGSPNGNYDVILTELREHGGRHSEASTEFEKAIEYRELICRASRRSRRSRRSRTRREDGGDILAVAVGRKEDAVVAGT
ncbi:MAG: hypothetical protein ACLTT1_16385 [[Clostridium] scindens]